jgi:hypothetical protein
VALFPGAMWNNLILEPRRGPEASWKKRRQRLNMGENWVICLHHKDAGCSAFLAPRGTHTLLARNFHLIKSIFFMGRVGRTKYTSVFTYMHTPSLSHIKTRWYLKCWLPLRLMCTWGEDSCFRHLLIRPPVSLSKKNRRHQRSRLEIWTRTGRLKISPLNAKFSAPLISDVYYAQIYT